MSKRQLPKGYITRGKKPKPSAVASTTIWDFLRLAERQSKDKSNLIQSNKERK